MAINANLATLLAGELPQFGRLAGGAICQYVDVTADGVVSFANGPVIYYGLRIIATGTSAIVYDNTTNSGTQVFNGVTSAAAAAGDWMVPPSEVGVILNNGLYADLTGGGTLRLFFAPAA
jgi:hypothetical protein